MHNDNIHVQPRLSDIEGVHIIIDDKVASLTPSEAHHLIAAVALALNKDIEYDDKDIEYYD